MINNKEKDPILREKELDGYRSIAQKIRNRLQQLENSSEKDKRRWIWELLQNAVDAGNHNKVSIEIKIDTDYIEFKHNGGVFTPRNVTNLVHQISSKEGSDNVGRFGTGFLTTHTLSKTVEVEGVFTPGGETKEYSKFNLRLNRNGKTERELVEKIEESWDSYSHEKLESPSLPFWTTFRYLEPDIQTARETLEDFQASVGFCLIFVRDIESIKIENLLLKQEIYIKFFKEENINEYIKLVTIQKSINNKDVQLNYITVFNSKINIAIEYNNENEIIPISKNVPRVFCSYPLIGSENFYFPFIINSNLFNPTQERDGLYLKHETPQSMPNKELLKQAIDLYKIALEFLYKNFWKKIYIVTNLKLPPGTDDFDQNWYKDNIRKPIREYLLTIPVVESPNKKLIYLKTNNDKNISAYFPYSNYKETREKIWKFLYDLSPNKLPELEHINDWNDIIWDDCEKITVEGLVYLISKFDNIENLFKHLKINKQRTYEWLNSLYKFIKDENSSLFDKHSAAKLQSKGPFPQRI